MSNDVHCCFLVLLYLCIGLLFASILSFALRKEILYYYNTIIHVVYLVENFLTGL